MHSLESILLKIQELRHRWRWLGYFLTGASLLYIAGLLFFGQVEWDKFSAKQFWLPITTTLVIYLASILLQFFVWMRMISPYRRAGWIDLIIFGRALLLRRLPGGVWHWVGRTIMYSDSTQVPGRVALLANFMEWILLLLVAAAIIIAGLGGLFAWLRFILVLACLAIAAGLIYSWLPAQRSRSSRFLEIIVWLFFYALSWLMGGIIILIFSSAVQRGVPALDMSLSHATWIWALTGGSSMALIVVPSGLGIRELTLTWVLGEKIGVEPALLVALLIRLSFLAADLLWGSLAAVATRWVDRDSGVAEPAVSESKK